LQNQFDYIITGSGCAGLSLLARILHEPTLQHKKILVIDAVEKNLNDRTWCFWEKQNGFFESLIHHRWQQLIFTSNQYSKTFSIEPYTYKMLRGIDFYEFVLQLAKQFANVQFVQEKVISIQSNTQTASVVTTHNTYTANYIFNSILFHQPKGKYNLSQHFKGWLIQTKEPTFNPLQAIFMDFTVSQRNGTTFMYMLPTTTNQALIEYTLFTDKLLPEENYILALQQYIQHDLKISNYTIVHEEFGVIPMTDASFEKVSANIIHIGTAGSQTKASSGYTFQFIQKQTASIVKQLVNKQYPDITKSWNDKKFQLFDKVLLNVLSNHKMPGDTVFAAIFKKNKPQRVLQFLDNETSLLDDIKIMQSVPINIFLPAALQEIIA
jgi:lycopene beta-cyclase